MDSQTLLNGFKALFSTLGAKTSNNNYAVPLVGANDGEPKGFMNMTNLASVLGVHYSTLGNNFDPDYKPVDDIFNLFNVISSDDDKKGLWFTATLGATAIQFRTVANNEDKIYLRKLLYSGGQQTWGQWKEL